MQTVGQLLLNESLPEDLRDPSRVLDKKGINDLLQQVAQRYPEKYRQISKTLSDIGWQASQESGGYSFGMQHLAKSKAAAGLQTQLKGRIQQLLDNDNLDDKTRNEQITKLAGLNTKPQQDAVYSEAMAGQNPLAYQVRSGARGNKTNLNSLLGGDMLYVDHRDQTIPVPITHSYSEGLTPAEYWAGSYGARKGVIDVKQSTQKAGYLSKQLNQVTHRLVVEDLDSREDTDNTIRGMPVNTEDPDNEGSLLASNVGPYKRNTVLTPKIIKHLAQLGNKQLLVRSPTVGAAPNGGVYARDVGVREHGNLPGRGEFPGMAAAQAIGEPISQGMLSSKHQGGVAGEGKTVSGFDYINQLVQVPEHFKGGAAHSEEDGIVGKVREAPQGGYYAFINGKEHYIPTDTEPTIKTGDKVEAGDVISTGIPNPAKIVQHKGIGEGRRYFVDAFRDALDSAGIKNNRRNIELLSRGLINHVSLTQEMGDYVPDDVVPYHKIEQTYKPRPDAKETDLAGAAGKYLEKPVLHYTIGTKVRPSVMKNLQTFGVKKVTVHHEPATFEPQMIRGMSNLANDPDWMTRMYGSGLKGSLLKGVHRGATSDERGSSFVPSLAKAVDFGNAGVVHSPEPGFEVKTSGDLMTVTQFVEQFIKTASTLDPFLFMSRFAKLAAPSAGVGASTPKPPVAPAAATPAPSIFPNATAAAGKLSPGLGKAPAAPPTPQTSATSTPAPQEPFQHQTVAPTTSDVGYGPNAAPVTAGTVNHTVNTVRNVGANAGFGVGALGAISKGGRAIGALGDLAAYAGVPLAGYLANTGHAVGNVSAGALSKLGPLGQGLSKLNANLGTNTFGTAGKWLGGWSGISNPSNYLNALKGGGNAGVSMFGTGTGLSMLNELGDATIQGHGNPVAGFDKRIGNDMQMYNDPNPVKRQLHDILTLNQRPITMISDATRDLTQIARDGSPDSWTSQASGGRLGAGGSFGQSNGVGGDIANVVMPGRALFMHSPTTFDDHPSTGPADAAKLNANNVPDASFKQNVANDGRTYWQHTGTGQSFSLNGREFYNGELDPQTRQIILKDMAVQKPEMLMRIVSDPVYAAYKANGTSAANMPPQAVTAQRAKIMQERAQGINVPLPGED